MKYRIPIIILLLLTLTACGNRREPLIGLSMAYRDGRYYINKSYVDAVRENGGRVRLIPCTQDSVLLKKELKDIDGIIFTGGRDYPPEWYGRSMHHTVNVMDIHRARYDSLFAQLALKSGKPVLGICAGVQLLAVATGGKLIRHVTGHRSSPHEIAIRPDSRMAGLFGDSMTVNSWHHQVVDPKYLNPDFRITAWAPDSIVEAIEYTGKQWIMGTQFHPERLSEELRDEFFTLFIREAGK
ncbi:MAG: gamma-glutamyl-gamma-aminobutyrate hydrolase family protein [Fidelibacterota bacterium]